MRWLQANHLITQGPNCLSKGCRPLNASEQGFSRGRSSPLMLQCSRWLTASLSFVSLTLLTTTNVIELILTFLCPPLQGLTSWYDGQSEDTIWLSQPRHTSSGKLLSQQLRLVFTSIFPLSGVFVFISGQFTTTWFDLRQHWPVSMCSLA